MRDRVDRRDNGRLGRCPDPRGRSDILTSEPQAESLRSSDDPEMRHERATNLRLSGIGSRLLRCQLLLRMFLVHVLQRMQIREKQDRSQVPIVRENRGKFSLQTLRRASETSFYFKGIISSNDQEDRDDNFIFFLLFFCRNKKWRRECTFWRLFFHRCTSASRPKRSTTRRNSSATPASADWDSSRADRSLVLQPALISALTRTGIFTT